MNSNFHMIDVGEKDITARKAIARGRIIVGEEAFNLIRSGKMKKGDVIALAEVAGICAAKKTPELVPLCHPIMLDKVCVNCEFEESTYSILVYCEAIAHAKTGVEMEALSGVMAALLAIYDVSKAVTPALQITDVWLEQKEGGKLGLWKHPQSK